MLKYLVGILPFILLASCDLSYTPPPTLENAATQRKRAVERYISDSYKDTNQTYQSLLFSETTMVKPNNYKILDSLYTLKYTNERNNVYDPELEEKINIQRTIIQLDTAKVTYIEHHVYAISGSLESDVYFSNVSITNALNVTDFQIERHLTIPTELIPAFTAYLTEESIVYPGYLPSQLESKFYAFYKEHEASLSDTEAEKFLVHTLKLIQLGRNLKTIESRTLLQELSVAQTCLRKYDPQKDKFPSIDGLYENNVLMEYVVILQADSSEYVVRYTPYLELKTIQKSN